MNTLLAESGSTKTDWVCTEGPDRGRYFATEGLNPSYLGQDALIDAMRTHVPAWALEGTDKVEFYGAGCSSPLAKANMAASIRVAFNGARALVEHDLLAAALSLCGKEPGVVAILGTGSNACRWDGAKVVNEAVNLGWALGDEGSGGHIGRTLIRRYFYGQMPPPVAGDFKAFIKVDRNELIEMVYRQPWPNRYMASLAPFALFHPSEYTHNLVASCFTEFIQIHIQPMVANQPPVLPIHATGGIAYNFKAQWAESLQSQGLVAGKVIERPLDGLLPPDLAQSKPVNQRK